MSQNGSLCEITSCGATANKDVDHPQRGEMVVCKLHAKRIQGLPSWRFIGQREVAR